MSADEYVLGLMLVISGLAITDMVASLHVVLLHRRSIRWDWLALTAAAYILLVIVNSWGISFRAFNRGEDQLQLWSFVLVLCQVIPLYLAARASLPDQMVGGLDLGEHYAFVCRYLWVSIAICFTMYLLISFRRGSVIESLESDWTAPAQLLLTIVLIASPRREVHRIVVPLMIVLLSVGHLTGPLFD